MKTQMSSDELRKLEILSARAERLRESLDQVTLDAANTLAFTTEEMKWGSPAMTALEELAWTGEKPVEIAKRLGVAVPQ